MQRTMMSGDEPYARHNGLVLLLAILASAIATPGLIFYGLRILIRARSRYEARGLAAATALFAWAATTGLYGWGLLKLAITDDYSEDRACNAVTGGRLAGYDPSFLPLELRCLTTDGRSVPAVVPSYFNPTLLALAIGATALTVAAFWTSRCSTSTFLRDLRS
ncbi:hypothetical protein ABZW10_29095 [Kitasatospora sp. NPDC004723]|uniref:hypothetical protein n=1 Tax=Kitasatospora sp. NPDC004723 TaxID=3154288 RepID=UPI0033BD4022